MGFHYLKQNITAPQFLSGLFWALLLLQPFSALAIVYQPGETLNPACAPTDAYCGVAAPITASSTSALSLGGVAPEGSLFYVAGTSTLQNIIPAGNLQYSIGSPESRLQNVYTNNLILGSASFVMEDVGGVLRFRDANSVIPGLVIDPSSGATINGNIFINGGATFTNATTTGSHSIGGALVLGGASFQNLVGVGLKVASSTLALDNSGDWAGTFDGQEASYFLANSFSTTSANLWLGGKTTNNLIEGSNLYWTTERGNQNFTSNLSATTTDALAEGAANKYYTDTRFDNRLTLKTTDDLIESGNLYYTDTRARNALSVSAPLSYSTSTGAFSVSLGYNIPLTTSTTNWNIAYNTVNASSTNWESAYSWGNHAMGGYLTGVSWGDIAGSLSGQTDLQNSLNAKESVITASTTATYFRGDKTFQTLDTSVMPENGNVYYTSARFTSDFATKSTSNLTEGSNLYYTDARARNALSATTPISYSTSTGFFSLATGDITAPSNPEITIGGGTGAVIGGGVNIVIPEAGATTRGLVSTTTQVFAGSKTFSSAPTFSTTNSGSVLFAGAGGLISQNNSNLFWDNANSRLGVGTASPNARLYVKTSDLASTPFYIEGQDNAFTGLSGWFYRKPVVIDNTVNSVSYSNQQTFVSINTADMISAGKLQSNCADLRFTNTDGTTILPHWVEYGCNSAGTGVWVQIPTLPAGITKTIYMYYGNATAASTSNGAGVFTFFDDFPTNQARFYNTEYPNWTVQTGSWIIPSGNYLANYYGGDMITVNSPSAGIGSAVRAKMTEAAAWKYARLLIGWQDANNYYAATLNSGGGQLNIQKVVGGTQTTLSNINASVTAGTWYEVELRWISSTAIEAQIWDVNGNSLGVAQGAISEGWTGGKFGASGSSGVSQARYENYMTLQYAPNLSSSIGAEESSGASQQFPFFVVKNQTGKVGIGEANPGAKLSVSGGLAIGSDFDTTSVSDGNAIFSGRLGVGVVSPSNALTFAAGSVIDSQGALSVTTASDGALSLTSNGSGNIVIDSGSNGALNIGTGANGKTITLGNTTGATGLVFNSGSGNINFDSNTLYVDTVNNRVGVGTANPGVKFHIIGDNNAAGFLFNTSDIGAVAVPFKITGTDVGSASTVLSSTVLTNNTTGGNQNVMLIENATGSGVTDALLKLNNADTDTAVVDGLLITSANGFITDAIDVSGINITNAINIGGNIIAGDSLSIDGDGNVGIGTTTPAQLLHIARSTDGVVARFTDANGDCDINPTNTALICLSDATLKKNVLTLESSLEKVLALNPVTFNWLNEEDDAATHLGFIAQDVEGLFPALVSTDEQGLKSLAHSNFAPILTKAIQEVASLGNAFKQTFIAWFADATNGIADFFAKKVHTEQICLKKSDGNEYCINGDDLEAIIDQKLSTSLSTSSVNNDAKEDVVLPEPQPQESITEFFPTEIETVAATTTEEVTEVTIELLPLEDQADVGLTKSYIGGSNPTSTEPDISTSDSDSNQEVIIDFLPD